MCLAKTNAAESEHRVAESKQLRSRIEEGANVEERVAGLEGVKAFCEALNREAEPYVVPLLPAILASLAHKVC